MTKGIENEIFWNKRVFFLSIKSTHYKKSPVIDVNVFQNTKEKPK